MKKSNRAGIMVVATNKRARFDYHLMERYEAGLVLTGTEIKSVRVGRVSLRRGYVQPRDGELWLLETHIAPYEYGTHENHEPNRPRKLLLHKREIRKIIDSIVQKGLTVVPIRLYLKKGRAKVEIALARGKRLHDKRQALAKRDSDRQVERALSRKFD